MSAELKGLKKKLKSLKREMANRPRNNPNGRLSFILLQENIDRVKYRIRMLDK